MTPPDRPGLDGASPAPPDTADLADLLRGARDSREALHRLVVQMQQERDDWERDLSQLVHRARLTGAQRQRLHERLDAMRRPRG
jgi:hypothetical protein